MCYGPGAQVKLRGLGDHLRLGGVVAADDTSEIPQSCVSTIAKCFVPREGTETTQTIARYGNQTTWSK